MASRQNRIASRMQAAWSDAFTFMASAAAAGAAGMSATRHAATSIAPRKDMVGPLPPHRLWLGSLREGLTPDNADQWFRFHEAATKMQIPATTGRGLRQM